MKISYSGIVKICFYLLSFLFFANINGIVYMMIGIKAPLSPIMLLLSIIVFYLGVFKLSVRLDHFMVLLIIVFYGSYLLIGLSSYLYDPQFVHHKVSLIEMIRTYASSIIIILAFYISSIVILRDQGIRSLFYTVLAFTILSCLFTALAPVVGLVDAYAYATAAAMDEHRNSGLFANPNEAGSFALYSTVVILACYGITKNIKWLLLPILGLTMYVAVLSFSKAAMILFPILILVYIGYFLTKLSRFRTGNVSSVVVFSLFILLVSVVATDQFFKYAEDLSYSQRTRLLHTFSLLSGEINKKTTSDRSVIYDFALKEIQNKPLQGHGLGSFHRLKYLPSVHKVGAHNTHLLIWGESGILPLLLFTLFFILLTLHAIRMPVASAGYFILGVVIVYFLNVAGTGHNGLDNRTSNALIGISLALVVMKDRLILSVPKRKLVVAAP